MTKRNINVIAAGIGAFFAVIILVLTAEIAIDYQRGPKHAEDIEERFKDITSDILSTAPAGSQKFFDAVQSRYILPRDIKSLTLETAGQTIYQYPASVSDSDGTSPLIHPYSVDISHATGSVRLSMKVYMINPADIYKRVRVAFFLTLAGTLLAAFLLLYVYLTEPTEYALPRNVQRAAPDAGTGIDDIPAAPAETEPAAVQTAAEPAVESTPLAQAAAAAAATSAAVAAATAAVAEPKSITGAAVPAADPVSAAAPAEPTESAKPADSVPAAADGTDAPTGLFSPATGFGWESYLKPRLASELVRAASSEQDLSLFIITIPGLSRDNPCTKEVCKILLDEFVFPDMLFEYKEDSFAAIKINEALDPAILRAQKFHSEISAALKNAQSDAVCTVGISARSLRIISADRLLNEAVEAAKHAGEDPDAPIIAFRVNPDKYRQYLAETAAAHTAQ